MKFPMRGPCPAEGRHRRLGPLRPGHGPERAQGRLPLQPPQIFNGGYAIRPASTTPRCGALRGRQAERGARSTRAVSRFKRHARGRGAGGSGERRDRGPVPGPGYPGIEVQRDRARRSTARSAARSTARMNMAVYAREQVGSSFKPYILAPAVTQGMNVQTSTLDGYNTCRSRRTATRRPTLPRPAAGRSGWYAGHTTTTPARTGRIRRRWRWRRRSTPPTPTCGTWSAGPTARTWSTWRSRLGVDTQDSGLPA